MYYRFTFSFPENDVRNYFNFKFGEYSGNPRNLALFPEALSPPVPGYPTLSSDLMARIWNNVPELQNASTRKWANEIP